MSLLACTLCLTSWQGKGPAFSALATFHPAKEAVPAHMTCILPRRRARDAIENIFPKIVTSESSISKVPKQFLNQIQKVRS